MRILRVAAVAAVLLSATGANAYYFQTSGIKGAPGSFGISGFDQSSTYYFQLESASLSGVGFEENWLRTTTFISGPSEGQTAYKSHQSGPIAFDMTPFGAAGTFKFPDNYGFSDLWTEFEMLKLYFYVPWGNTANEPDGTPWTLTISDSPLTAPGSVPEPATWAMMIAGFGLVGSALRRRRPTLA